MILDTTSMVRTIDQINEKFLVGEKIDPGEGLEAARWLASRQGAKGAYRDMFAPTPEDYEAGMHIFTGERLVSASARHIMGQEAARAAWLLGRSDAAVRGAYEKATGWMHALPEFINTGTFCCGRCTLAFWRHYWAADFEAKEDLVTRGIGSMQTYRLGDGRWRRFPFYYAIYTLQDLDLPAAREELKYALPVLERYVKRSPASAFDNRRLMIARKALDALH
jgi:hypothetical protein